MGRRSKFQPVTVEAILERLKGGATRRAAAESMSVDESTFYDWYANKQDFRGEVDRAEAEAELRNALLLEKAANGYDVKRTTETLLPDGTRKIVTETAREWDWRAAESWLKRRRPEEWGDRVEVKQLSDEQIVRALNRAARQRSGGAGAGDPGVPAGLPANGNGKH